MVNIPLALRAPDPLISIRPARLSDVDALHAGCWPNRSFTTVYELVHRAERAAAEHRGLALVVTGAENQVCGYGQIMAWPSCAEISDMVIMEPYRGLGYGTALIQALVDAGQKMGMDEIEIGAAVNNPRAAVLYRRLGFQDSHTVMLNFGYGKEHVLFLRLSLKAYES